MKRNTLFAVILIILLAACSPEQPASVEPPYTELRSKYNITEEDQRALAEFSYAVIDNYFEQDAELKNIASNAFQDFDYDKVFLTYLHQGGLRCSQGSGSNRIAEALTDANLACIEDERFGGTLTADESQDVEIVFNFFFDRNKLNYTDLEDLEDKIEVGIHAIEMETGGKRVYFKESVLISHNLTLEETFKRLCLKAEQPEECYLESGTDVFIYDTYTFKANRQYEITDLYRYNVYIDVESITPETILESLQLTEEWFLNNTNPETGRLEYMYYPSSDSYSTDNNHVRQVAAMWAMSELQDFLGDDRLDDVITNMLDHYLQYMTEDGYLWIDGSSTIAYNAFVIMTLLGHEYPDRDRLITELADAVVSQQNEDGSYDTYFESDRNSGVDFYPGEAMLALMTLYHASGGEQYLESVQKAYPYYRDYWRGNKNTAFVPWHSRVYLLLYEATENQEVAEFVFEMSDWIISRYQTVKTEYPDNLGGFTKSFPRNSTSVYMEGINDAYTLAVLTGNEEKQTKYAESIRIAVRFILQMQYTPENVFYLENPSRAIGGFRHSLIINEQRIDYAQHATFALIKAYNNGIFE